MKNMIVQTAPLLISLLWIELTHQTINPFSLRGPEFLGFYSILLFGWYIALFFAQFSKKSISKTTVFFAALIFFLGTVKFIKGVYLGKPVGFLIMMLISHVVFSISIISIYIRKAEK